MLISSLITFVVVYYRTLYITCIFFIIITYIYHAVNRLNADILTTVGNNQ